MKPYTLTMLVTDASHRTGSDVVNSTWPADGQSILRLFLVRIHQELGLVLLEAMLDNMVQAHIRSLQDTTGRWGRHEDYLRVVVEDNGGSGKATPAEKTDKGKIKNEHREAVSFLREAGGADRKSVV